MSSTLHLEAPDKTGAGSGDHKVVIFNNDHTPQQLVTAALMAATKCDRKEAEIEVWEAEHYGKAAVHYASRAECEEVAQVMKAIGVESLVSTEWAE